MRKPTILRTRSMKIKWCREKIKKRKTAERTDRLFVQHVNLLECVVFLCVAAVLFCAIANGCANFEQYINKSSHRHTSQNDRCIIVDPHFCNWFRFFACHFMCCVRCSAAKPSTNWFVSGHIVVLVHFIFHSYSIQ